MSYVTPAQARTRLAISRTLFDKSIRPHLDERRVGRRVFFSIRSLDEFIESSTVRRPNAPAILADSRRLRAEIAELTKEGFTDADPTYVYIIAPVTHGTPVKIGIARDVTHRLKRLQVGSHLELEVCASFLFHSRMLAALVETLAHEKFQPHRKRGEWFKIDRRVAAEWIRTRFAAVLA